MAVFILHHFDRVGKVLEDNSFFLRLFYLHHVGRHLVFGSSVDVVNFLGAQSYCCSASVHGGVSASDDGNLSAHADFFVSDYSSQEVDTADDAFCIFALAAYSRGYPCADSQKNSVIVASYRLKRNVDANLCVGDDFHSHAFDGSDFFVQNCLRKSVFRNSVSQHTARIRHGLEYCNVVSHLSQEVSGRQSHRAAAYDSHALACVFFTFRHEHFAFKIHISCKSLQLLNGYRLVYETSSAGFFARMRAHSSESGRKRNLILYEFESLLVLSVGYEAYISLAVGLSRTSQYARRSAVACMI